MDESAEWRRRYDTEVVKVNKCSKELSEVYYISHSMVDIYNFNC